MTACDQEKLAEYLTKHPLDYQVSEFNAEYLGF